MPKNMPKIEDSVFVDIPVKELPPMIRKRHKKRQKKMDKLHEKLNVLHEEEKKDLLSMITKEVE